MRKIVVLIIVICMFVPTFSMAYSDLSDNHFAYKDIHELSQVEIALGYPDGTFRPDTYITEEELITILLRGANLDACRPFKNWPEDYIELGLNNGIVIDESLVTETEFIELVNKISVLASVNNLDESFNNRLSKKAYLLQKASKSDEYLTRAEVCIQINKLLNADGKITPKDLPQKSEVYYTNNEELDVLTVINQIDVFNYDDYTGEYAEIINSIKTGEHPYMKGRNKKAIGKKVVAIEFDTINNSQYGVWTSYKSLKFDGIQVIDAFDLDEIKNQLMNCAYDAILIKPNEKYMVTAFYIVDNIPNELTINRDITTLYNLQTHQYVDICSFSNIEVKL